MKTPPASQSATSLRRAPADDASARMRKYFIMMSVRTLCFLLTVLVTPYSWYTWVFAIGAVFLPYVAVVLANVGQDGHEVPAVSPNHAIPAAAAASAPVVVAPTVIQIQESSPDARS